MPLQDVFCKSNRQFTLITPTKHQIMKYLGIIGGLFFMVIACNAPQGSPEQMTDSNENLPIQQGVVNAPTQTRTPVVEQRKIIKTGDVRFQVKSLDESTSAIEKMTQDYQGFISNMEHTNSSYYSNNRLSIRIPIDKFDAFLFQLKQQSIYTNYIKVNSEDVTEEFIDIQSRLKTKKEVKKRYVQILSDKAKTIEDVLNAEEKIRVIQEEIESKEGRLKYLQNQVALSTIHVEMYQEVDYSQEPVVYNKTFGDSAGESFMMGWNAILEFVISLITIWPLLIIGTLVLLFRKRIRRKGKKEV